MLGDASGEVKFRSQLPYNDNDIHSLFVNKQADKVGVEIAIGIQPNLIEYLIDYLRLLNVWMFMINQE